MSIPNLHPVVAMHLGSFLDSLYVDPLANMDVFRARNASYISIEQNSKKTS